jgi:hypothetical protein
MYFNSFPKIITTDYKNNLLILTNLMVRSEIIPSLLKNPLIFYSYDVKESDRPDIIADKYYNDSNRFWMIFYANQTINPQWDLPLTSQQFDKYIINKYMSVATNGQYIPTIANTANTVITSTVVAYITNTIQEYRKTITTYDSVSLETNSRTIIVDANTANHTTTGTTTKTFSDGTFVTQAVTVQPISIYQYELEQNDAKRNINLVNASYASQLEKDFQTLMRQ